MKITTLVACLGLASTAIAAPTQESLVELIPAKAKAAFIARHDLVGTMEATYFADREPMRQELQAYLEKSLGMDLTRVDAFALFVTDAQAADKHIGFIVRMPPSTTTIKLPNAGDAGGTPMYTIDAGMFAARIKAGMVFGSEDAIRAAVAVDRGRDKPLAKDSGLGKLLSIDVAQVDAILAVGPGVLPPDQAMGVEDAQLVYKSSGLFELALHGDPNKLQLIKSIAVAGIQAGVAQLATEKDKAVAATDVTKGVAAIFAYHEGKRLAAELDPKLAGNTLSMTYQLPTMKNGNGSLLFATVGILAAVAVPAFQKYIARSKTVEATMNLRKLYDTLAGLATDNPKKLASLRSTDWTPKVGCCGQPDNQCAPRSKDWSSATWQALNFSIDDRSRYQYRVQIVGKGKAAKYVVEARGDLDCDNELSHFQRTMTIGPNGPDGGPGLESSNETE